MHCKLVKQTYNRIWQLCHQPPCHHLVKSTKHNAVYESGPMAPLCQNITSSTKLKQVLHYCQRSCEPWPQVTGIKFFVKLWHMVFEVCEWKEKNRQTGRHTDMLTAILCTLTGGKVIIDWVKVLRPTRHKIGHFGDVLPSKSPGLVLKNWNKHNKSKHVSIRKYTKKT